MKKIFTLMLTFACAMFVGVSCTTDPNDGANGGGSKEAFTAVWDTENATPSEIAVTVTAANKKGLFFCAADTNMAEWAMMGVSGATPLEKISSYLTLALEWGMVDPANPDFNVLFKGNTDCVDEYDGSTTVYPKTIYRNSDDAVGLHAVGVKFTADAETGMYTYEFTTDLYTFNAPMPGYPTITLCDAVHPCSADGGYVELSCVLKNPMEGTELEFDGLPSWASVEWADDVLTITCDSNPSKLERTVEVSVSYGMYSQAYTKVTQAGSANVETPTFTFEVKTNEFNRLVVDVKSSNADVKYYVSATPESSIWGSLVSNAESTLRSISAEDLYTGDLTDKEFKLNVSNYQNWDDTYSPIVVYAYPVYVGDNGLVLLDKPQSIEVTVDVSKMPTLTWAEDDRLVWNEAQNRYNLNAKPGDVITLTYVLTNPADGGVVCAPSYVYDSMNVIKDNAITVDTEACTVTFTADEFDTTQKWGNYFNLVLYYNHSEDSDWNWNVQTPQVRVIHVQE